ncbi:hypothetical protein GGR34_002547 [Microvirga flocculans]|uniref:Uncharacterized protein n=1 Tax=Microvirga flocculans TaxID=217168 RepID=A0A7W6N866_9HYPH|nr:hypothetical protein [Microvirga flocculans]MBB4040888.1 hypothetical protein [Microvirga flocculans]
MRQSSFSAASFGLALLASMGASAQESSPDLYPNAPKGRLTLTIELQGSGRKDLPNKVEWYRLVASRKLELEFAMVVPTKATVPFVKVGGIDKENAPMPAGMAAIGEALKVCKGDEACQRQTMMAIGQKMMANPQAMGGMKQDDTRFENWLSARNDACAKGTLLAEDTGDGVIIDPPAPAKPYSFRRKGRLDLPSQDRAIMDKACEVEMSVDRQTGLLSLRLQGFGLPVPVQMTGANFAPVKSVTFLEGRPKIEVLDQKIDPKANAWSGQATLEKAGSVSHNSGQTVAPMSGTLSWRFVRD